ncbi:hypothetical protein ElyMa_003998500 [Elysia marginata]|uniref:Uncharacterized protein n=1 Tax=Elysia marginata TaxID=1093978 RepID=A0AAV4FYR9_9GAST|nr:hypothetical protein ElyMa_003998500 [Elysia marginata]
MLRMLWMPRKSNKTVPNEAKTKKASEKKNRKHQEKRRDRFEDVMTTGILKLEGKRNARTADGKTSLLACHMKIDVIGSTKGSGSVERHDNLLFVIQGIMMMIMTMMMVMIA